MEFAFAKKEYDKLERALEDVHDKGYGMVTPTMEDMVLEEPELMKKGGSFCVRLKKGRPYYDLSFFTFPIFR